ncbi:hypothetical protein [Actinoplanes sp. N902-109]|uniref:hypothetical protein n=1 Tax=Actinoplanes sp. (strain N902-109) TaxID=649831 RepID=UPI0003295CAF|nr:hypothetical protein [Actinoplanes sp. N902-109]AGL19492.1 hypothetical protein L083_5982 [Actinoplanes sp. N902-109]
MAGTITTTTDATALDLPGQSFVDTKVKYGGSVLFAVTLLGTQLNIWRSTNRGADAWGAQSGMALTRAGIVELGGWFIDVFGYGHLTYRVFEGGKDRIMYRRVNLESDPNAWGSELMVCEANASSAGQVYTGSDLVAVKAGNQCLVAIAAAFVQGGTQGVELHAFRTATGSAFPSTTSRATSDVFTGSRKWTWAGAGRQTPVVDLQHGGDGHTAASPDLWVVMGRTQVRAAHLTWSGSRWSGPSTAAPIANPVVAQDSIAARWTAERLMVAGTLATSPDAVTVWERDSSNSYSIARSTPVHPAGVVRSKALSYDFVTRDIRVWAVGTSSSLLYFVDYNRAAGAWTDWAQLSTTALQDYRSYSVRRGSWGTAKYDLLWEPTSASPYSIVHVQQPLSYPPDAPDWTYPTPASGSAANSADTLQLNFAFSDPSPADYQTAYAMSRQIGSGAVQYWRDSDRTWQATEIKNATSSNYVQLSPGWGAVTDPPHAYRARVWDSSDTASAYGPPVIVIPSVTANPTLTQPVDGATWTAESLNVLWTVAEQTAHTQRLYKVFDDFQRTFTSPGPMGQGYAAVAPLSAYTVAAGVLTMSLDTVSALRRLRAEAEWASRELYVEFQMPVTPTGAPIHVALMMAWVTGPTFVGAQVSFGTNGSVTLNLIRSVNNALTRIGNLAVFPAGGHSTTRWYGLRVRYTGDYEAKLWDAAGPEPTTWDVINTSGPLGGELAPGGIGLQTWIDAGNTNALPIPVRWRQWTRGITDLVADSGMTPDPGAREVVVPYSLPNDSPFRLELQTRNLAGLPSDIESAAFTVDYIEPPQPVLQVTPQPDSGLMRIDVSTPPPVGQTLANPSFETDTTGWAGASAGIARSNAQALDGTWSALVTPDGAGTNAGIEPTAAARATVAAGQQWTAEAWMRPATANKQVRIGLVWYDASAAVISTAAATFAPTAGEWQFVTVTAVAPAGAVRAGVHAGLTNIPTQTDTAHVDALRLAPTTGQPATASVDVYRAVAGDPDSVVRIAAGLPQNPTVEDRRAVGGVDYLYLARAYGTNGARIDSAWT